MKAIGDRIRGENEKVVTNEGYWWPKSRKKRKSGHQSTHLATHLGIIQN
ncbi:hypothetical protein [Neobacillus rhizosphaerae]|nr:hypothetical protein [Neobacillus rhizosphaerae]